MMTTGKLGRRANPRVWLCKRGHYAGRVPRGMRVKAEDSYPIECGTCERELQRKLVHRKTTRIENALKAVGEALADLEHEFSGKRADSLDVWSPEVRTGTQRYYRLVSRLWAASPPDYDAIMDAYRDHRSAIGGPVSSAPMGNSAALFRDANAFQREVIKLRQDVRWNMSPDEAYKSARKAMHLFLKNEPTEWRAAR